MDTRMESNTKTKENKGPQEGSQEKFKEFVSDQKKWKEIQKKFLKKRKSDTKGQPGSVRIKGIS